MQLNIECIIIELSMLSVINLTKPKEKPRIKRVGAAVTFKWMIENNKEVKIKINNLPFLSEKYLKRIPLK